MRSHAVAVKGSSALLLAVLLASASAPARAEGDADDPSAADSAAFFFAYRPKPGMERLFEEGYRRHLDWHREKQDPLPWYAWTVTTGDRVGLFIDGSLGVPFSAFDQRVDLAGDVADFAQTTAPFAETVSRGVYRFRPDLSGPGASLGRSPAPFLEVACYGLRPGGEERFETVLRRLAAAPARGPDAGAPLWYQRVVGGATPGFLLLVPRASWADLGAGSVGLERLLERALGAHEARALAAELTAVVDRIETETWSYRADLSYIPPEP